ncbi:MAG: carboxylesterase family protein, partial [Proteobacteria bacterium]|nr:carboxylesterase family protein [Pseudomonadota bacterium]
MTATHLRLPTALAAGLVVLNALACGGPEPEPPVVVDETSRRTLAQGEIVGFTGGGAQVWLGIPFARPPTGALRWRAPRPPEPWTGTREALAFGESCMQFAGPIGAPEGVEPGQPTGSEDCLTLNVFAPKVGPDAVPRGPDRWPVLLWIHGGGNTIGDARPFDGKVLAGEHDVVLVTVHYRLGAFGWFAHEALRAGETSPEDLSGNYGTLDQIRALEWVRDNIAAFGGDPERVTIFGESAGGSDVFALLQSPRAAGLFHRAISQSGSTRGTAMAEAEELREEPDERGPHTSNELLVALRIADDRAPDRDSARAQIAELSGAEISAYLRGKTAAEIMGPLAGSGLGGMYRWPENLRDGFVLPSREPMESYEQGEYNRVPVIVGSNRDEAKLFLLFGSDYVRRVFGIPLWVSNPRMYLLAADYQSQLWKVRGVDAPARAMRAAQGPTVYAYRFDWDEEPKVLFLDLGRYLGAAHAIELPFVFGRLDLGRATRLLFDEDRMPAAEALSASMVSYWTRFAATGDPGRGRDGSLPPWLAWDESTAESGRFMVFDTEADGGLRMSSEAVTRAGVLARLAADDDFADEQERCAFYRS